MNSNEWEEIPDYGDLFPISEFVEMRRNRILTDFDGHGEWATETHMRVGLNIISDYANPPSWATHVVWFNK